MPPACVTHFRTHNLRRSQWYTFSRSTFSSIRPLYSSIEHNPDLVLHDAQLVVVPGSLIDHHMWRGQGLGQDRTGASLKYFLVCSFSGRMPITEVELSIELAQPSQTLAIRNESEGCTLEHGSGRL